MITTFLAHIGAFFFKWGLFFSHLKYQAAILTGNLHIIIHHWTWKETLATARPFLRWSPV